MRRNEAARLPHVRLVLGSSWRGRSLLAAASVTWVILASACSGAENANPDQLPTSDPERNGEGGGGGGEGGPQTGPDGGGPPTDPSATHFASTVTEWALPVPGAEQGYFATQGSFRSAERWSTLDITGDGLPDLVSPGTNDPPQGGLWGTKGSIHWKVFKNTGTRFEAASLTWPTPQDPSIRAVGFDVIDTTPSGGAGGVNYWNTFDVTGDGRPDLVVTAEYTAAGLVAFGSAGARQWKVLKNNGAGFDKPLSWPVPDGGQGAAVGFYRKAFDNRDQSADLVEAWTTLDMDGDKRADLVVTGRGVGTGGVAVWGTAGAHHWKVYKNNGTGFDKAAATWPVPEGGLGSTRGFWGVKDINGSAGLESWVTEDVTGDGLPDLVSTGRAIADLGSAAWGTPGARHWKVFENTGAGFATTATTWTVPDTTTNPERGFSLYSTAITAVGEVWSTLDMTGDGRPDLVVMAVAVNDAQAQFGTPGARHWKVYKNRGNGFETTAITWTSPDRDGSPTGGYSGLTSFPGSVTGEKWQTFDINNDKVPDLVVTGQQDGLSAMPKTWGPAGMQYWKVFPGMR